jgi:hypothetical protein
MAVEARLADQKTKPAAELEGNAFDFPAKRVEVAGLLTRARRNAGRRAKDSELGEPDRIDRPTQWTPDLAASTISAGVSSARS